MLWVLMFLGGIAIAAWSFRRDAPEWLARMGPRGGVALGASLAVIGAMLTVST